MAASSSTYALSSGSSSKREFRISTHVCHASVLLLKARWHDSRGWLIRNSRYKPEDNEGIVEPPRSAALV